MAMDPILKKQRADARKAVTREKQRIREEEAKKERLIKQADRIIKRLTKEHNNAQEKVRKNLIWQAEQNERITTRLKAQHRKYHWLWQHAHEIPRDELNIHARDLASALYDLPIIFTGYKSEALLEQGGDPCPEHFHPRQWAGHVLLEYIFFNQGIEMDMLRRFADVFRQVHHTTSEENNRLRPHQLVGTYETWEKSYEDAGIKLVHKKDNGPIRNIGEIWVPVAV